jgi:hypothetical protein
MNGIDNRRRKMNDELMNKLIAEVRHHNSLMERLVNTVELVWGSVHPSNDSAKEANEANKKRGIIYGIIPSAMQKQQQTQQQTMMTLLGNQIKGGKIIQ